MGLNYVEIIFFLFVAIFIVIVLLPLMVGFFVVHPNGQQEIIDCLDLMSNWILGVGVPIEGIFFMCIFLGFFMGLALRWANPIFFYIGALLCIGPIAVTHFFSFCFTWGVLFLYLELGFTLVLALNVLEFFWREVNVPVERWLLIKYWKFKGLAFASIVMVIWKLRFSLIVEIQWFLIINLGLLVLIYSYFLIKSYWVKGSIRCHKVHPNVLIFSQREYWALVPASCSIVSYVFFELPLGLAFAGVFVSVGPLVLYFLILKINFFRQAYIFIIIKIRQRYTYVYILTVSVFFFHHLLRSKSP